jgi:hypothetical protein
MLVRSARQRKLIPANEPTKERPMEAMAAESIVAASWELDGYLTKVRWPIKVPGGYSDIDAVGITANGKVRLAKCKVRMGPRLVYVIGKDVEFANWLGAWVSCVDNVQRLWDEQPPWLPTMRDTDSLEMWFCANLWLDNEEAEEQANRGFTNLLRQTCPSPLKHKVRGRVISTRDVIFSIIAQVRTRIVDEAHGRRFGNPILDVIRELVRFANPVPKDGRRCSRQVSDQTQARLLEALGFAHSAAPDE